MSSRALVGRWLSVVALLPALGCNAVLGIDAPDLVGPDASADGGPGDAMAPDADAAGDADATVDADAATDADATVADSAALDSTVQDARDAADVAADAPVDSGIQDSATDAFDGNCSCDSGACAPVVLATAQHAPAGIAIDSTRVYWLDEGSAQTNDGALMSVNRDGTNPAIFAPGLYAPSDLAVGGGMVYWSTPAPASVLGQSTGLPTHPQTLAANYANAIAATVNGAAWTTASPGQAGVDVYATNADAGGALLVADPANADRIAMTTTDVFWGSSSGVSTCPLGGCSAPVPFWTSQGTATVSGIAVDSFGVYWTEESTGGVYACPNTGCPAQQPQAPIYMPTGGAPTRLASDGTNLYVITTSSNPPAGSIVRMALDGTGATVIATGQQPIGLALGDTCVYWTDQTAGTVYASPK